MNERSYARQTNEPGIGPKRKSPFIASHASSESSTPRGDPKIPRQELPELRINECELVCDLNDMMEELSRESNPGSSRDDIRVERSSSMCQTGNLRFQLVCFLGRKSFQDEPDEPVYDLGLYIRAEAPEPSSDEWVFLRTSIILMLINAADPFSRRSRVMRDVCNLSESDPCRGWPSVVSFSSLSELEEEGFLSDSGHSIRMRAQAYFPGDPTSRQAEASSYLGLENQGATCYLNGLLQSLFHIGRFREIVYSTTGEEDKNHSIISALQSVFYELEANHPLKKKAASSEPLTEAFGWDRSDVGVQHDVQEMNRLLIERLEEGDLDLKQLFCGSVENFISCTDIEYNSTRSEDFYDVQLNVGGCTSIEEALSEYLSVELLEGPNAYDAGEGRGMQRAKKGVRFRSLPPILTFQLMRFQFDFDSGDFRKLSNKFEFSESLDMSLFCPGMESEGGVYKLYSVLVHSGLGVNGGHYYAFLNVENQKWIKFDDETVHQVDAFTAIDDNFGGDYEFRNDVVNYLVPSSSSSTHSRQKPYSAYMLMYVREKEIEELLRPVRLEDVNPALITTGRKEEKKISVNFFNLDSPFIFDTPILSCSDLVQSKSHWFHGELLVSESLSIKEVISLQFGEKQKSISVFVLVDSRLVELNIDSDEILTDSTIGQLSSQCESPILLLVTHKVLRSHPQDIPIALLEFVPNQGDEFLLQFRGIVCIHSNSDIRKFLPHHSIAFVLTDGFLMEPVSPDSSVEAGAFLVYHNSKSGFPESARDYYIRIAHTSDITIHLHERTCKWLLNGVPAQADVFDPRNKISDPSSSCITLKKLDSRLPLDHLLSFLPIPEQKSRFMLFHRNPFKSRAEQDLFDPTFTIEKTLNRTSFEYHSVFIPLPDGPPVDRWNKPHPLLVRIFTNNVIEINSDIIYMFPSDTVADLVEKAKTVFSLNPDAKYRLLDVDIVNCEISACFAEDDTKTPLSTLLFWGASNIFVNSVRIEPDESSDSKIFCSHLDRSSRSRFGHPFILDIPEDDETDRESQIAQKLNVANSLVKTWRLIIEPDDNVVISHPCNPFNTEGTPRERALVIKS